MLVHLSRAIHGDIHFRDIMRVFPSDRTTEMTISGTVTHLRFIKELDRDADRGGELAHFDCVTANEDRKRLQKVENKPESFLRAQKGTNQSNG